MQPELKEFIDDNISKDGMMVHKKYMVILDGRIKTVKEDAELRAYARLKSLLSECYLLTNTGEK